MARDLTFIPLTLNTSSGYFRVGCLSVELKSDIDHTVVRANPKDWTMHRWKGGQIVISGLLYAATAGGHMAAELPEYLTSIELASGQNLYECRLIHSSTGTGGGRSTDSLVEMKVVYSFLTYGSPSTTVVFGDDGTNAGDPTLLARWLPSSGARGYVNTASGRFKGFHLGSCTVNKSFKNYEAPSLPTVIPVYTGSSMTISGLADNPTLNMATITLEWLQHVITGPSGSVLTTQIDHAVLTGQSATVVMHGFSSVIMYSMDFVGSQASSISSNSGDWYYA